jgi:glycosyltransferase involved in cell wall biosynthesis
MNTRDTVAIIASWIGAPWGGSEELWAQTATLLAKDGVNVAASVGRWRPQHRKVSDLISEGINVWERTSNARLWQKALRTAFSKRMDHDLPQIEKFLRSVQPGIAILQSGRQLPHIDVVELCVENKIPFATIGQANSEEWWFEDNLAERYRRALPWALRCYFVSHANRRLTERQIGLELRNAEIVQNPFNVDYDVCLPWPRGYEEEIRLACVGRLDIPAKGQDILLEALSGPAWRNRRWHLTFYGEGSMKNSIERMIDHFELRTHATIAGWSPNVERIWQENHALVLASRLEGLPLVIVEAMLCGRPVIATKVAGNGEVVQDGVTGFLADAPTSSSFSVALERFWERRNELKSLGEAAGRAIRKQVGPEPARVFAGKIKLLLREVQSCDAGHAGTHK